MKNLIILGSTSQHKLNAVRRVVSGSSFNVIGIKTDSNQNKQPIGMEEAVAGALTRAKCAQAYDPEAIALGIESGIIRTGKPLSVSIDMAVIVALYKSEQIIVTSAGLQFPEELVDIAEQKGFETCTVGSVIAEKLGGDGTDPYSALTQQEFSREQAIYEGLQIIYRLILKKIS
jgi:non-canonical (house-cleaning) NTP pyrophosphatase